MEQTYDLNYIPGQVTGAPRASRSRTKKKYGARMAKKKAKKRALFRSISYNTIIIALLTALTCSLFIIAFLTQEHSNMKTRVYNATIPELERSIILGIE